jgi:glucitol/sorbitol PTS system EIIA component
LRYSTVVTAVGPQVDEFVEGGVLVLFAEGAPEELHDFSVMHRPDDAFEEVHAGDQIHFGEQAVLKITSVGDVANNNLRSLGHAVFKCNGKIKSELPGDICLEEAEMPSVEVGQRIWIDQPA